MADTGPKSEASASESGKLAPTFIITKEMLDRVRDLIRIFSRVSEEDLNTQELRDEFTSSPACLTYNAMLSTSPRALKFLPGLTKEVLLSTLREANSFLNPLLKPNPSMGGKFKRMVEFLDKLPAEDLKTITEAESDDDSESAYVELGSIEQGQFLSITDQQALTELEQTLPDYAHFTSTGISIKLAREHLLNRLKIGRKSVGLLCFTFLMKPKLFLISGELSNSKSAYQGLTPAVANLLPMHSPETLKEVEKARSEAGSNIWTSRLKKTHEIWRKVNFTSVHNIGYLYFEAVKLNLIEHQEVKDCMPDLPWTRESYKAGTSEESIKISTERSKRYVQQRDSYLRVSGITKLELLSSFVSN